MSMNAQERQKLAEKLAKLDYQKARKEVRRLDPDADLKMWQNSVGDGEYHTTYDCPNLAVRVILVEKPRATERGPRINMEFYYTEARVVEHAPLQQQ